MGDVLEDYPLGDLAEEALEPEEAFEPEEGTEQPPEPAPAQPEAAEPVDEESAEEGTDAIVRAAKAMRDIHETRQARSRLCLVADDSRVIRKISSKIARNMGYEVIEAQDGGEALARCKQRMPDLVLTDWQMPEMDGIEFVTELRAIPTPRAPTVVFCTSKGAAADIHEGIAAGADDFVIKPFDEAALRTKLEKLGVG